MSPASTGPTRLVRRTTHTSNVTTPVARADSVTVTDERIWELTFQVRPGGGQRSVFDFVRRRKDGRILRRALPRSATLSRVNRGHAFQI
jgi:hypothetical protein